MADSERHASFQSQKQLDMLFKSAINTCLDGFFFCSKIQQNKKKLNCGVVTAAPKMKS